MTADDYMVYRWNPVWTRLPGGGWQLTVDRLPGFEFCAATKEDLPDWRSALRAYLDACLSFQIPIPPPELEPPKPVEVLAEGVSVFAVDWAIPVAA
jgi:hypothetical protein